MPKLKKWAYPVIVFMFLFAGCDYIAPNTEKSKTEKKQLKELKKQTAALERIAVAIERHR